MIHLIIVLPQWVIVSVITGTKKIGLAARHQQINVSQNLPRRSDAAPEIARGRRDSWLRGYGFLLCLFLVDQRREEREEDESRDAFRAVRCFRQSGLNRNSKMIIIPFTQIYST